MPAKKYHIDLTDQERSMLEQMLRRGKHSARKLTRAHILLKADFGLRDLEAVLLLTQCIFEISGLHIHLNVMAVLKIDFLSH